MFRPVLPLLLIAVSGRSICGQICSNRIIGGSAVDIKQAPYQANIVVDGSPICSGAIIGEKAILTAAECVYGCYTSSVRVRVGTSVRESGGTLARVCGIRTHPLYSSWRYDNNLALLELCEPLEFSDSVRDIMVADKLPEDTALVEMTGWGSTSWWGSWWDRCFGSLPFSLQGTAVRVHNREQCAWDLSVWFGLWDNGVSDLTLCTYSNDRSACSYDTGAPLVKDGQLVGILSYGGCTSYPDVFASMPRFRTWLAEVTATEKPTTITPKPTSTDTTTTLTTPTKGSTTTMSTEGPTKSTTTMTTTSTTMTTTTSTEAPDPEPLP